MTGPNIYDENISTIIDCLTRASAIDSQENREAIALIGDALKVARVEMNGSNSPIIKGSLILYDTPREIDHSRFLMKEFENHDGGVTTYKVYQTIGEPDWTEIESSKIQFFLKLLYQANRSQFFSSSLDFYQYHDAQTYHHNVNYFSKKVEAYIAQRKINQYAALSINLRGFTNLNISIGSEKCDIVLVEYMNWLSRDLSEDEVVARISGDNFALLVRKEHLQWLLGRIKEAVIPYGEEAYEVATISAVAGVYELNGNIKSVHHVIRGISTAVNEARNSWTSHFAFYDSQIEKELQKRKYYEEALKAAMKKEEIEIYYQPKVSLRDYRLVGAEALSRWFVDGVMMPPDEFIPTLERSNRICELDFYVLDQVCKNMYSWMEQGIEPVKVSINFSRRHLANRNLVPDIMRVLKRYSIPPKYIEVELTETTIDADFEALKHLVAELKANGIDASVDDFGTGYSSLSLIRDVPFKVLKIDKSFLRGDKEEEMERRRAMMRHVIGMANELGMDCIAEGVETIAQVQLLKESKCYMAQGYLFNRPLPHKDFIEKLKEREE